MHAFQKTFELLLTPVHEANRDQPCLMHRADSPLEGSSKEILYVY